jgi:uncharacterized protein (DUF362 family)
MINLNRRSFLYTSWLLASAVGTSGCLDPVKAMLKKPRGRREPLSRDKPPGGDGKSLVSAVHGRDVKAMVHEAMALLGGMGAFGIKGKTVLVKPNVVSGRANPTTTNPEVVKAVVGLLYEEGASRVYVGDMSALGRLPTSKNMEKTGIKKAAEGAGAEVIHFEEHDFTTVMLPGARYIKEVGVSEWIFKVDRIVNLPVVKTHRSAQYSICLKNFVGATHFNQRPYFVDSSHWEEVVAELNLAYQPDLNVVDGTAIMVEGGPWSGTSKKTDLVLASGDRVAADVVGLGLIKAFGLWKGVSDKDVWDQRQIRRAVEAGLGAKNGNEIQLLIASLDKDREFDDLMARVRDHIKGSAMKNHHSEADT